MYFADITTDTPLMTAVFTFKVVINNTYFDNPQAVLISTVRNDLTESTFKLDNGRNDDDVLFGFVNEVTAADQPVITIERSIVYFAEPPPEEVRYPMNFDFDISAVVVSRTNSGLEDFVRAESLGSVTLREPPG